MPPPTPDLVNDCWEALQDWLDTLTDGQTAELPEGSYRCQHRLALNADINLIGGAVEHSGACTAATTTTVTQTGAGWTTDEHAGRYVILTSGAQDGRTRRVVSNTATVLTVVAFGDKAAPAPPDPGDTFDIHSRPLLKRFPEHDAAGTAYTSTTVADSTASWTVNEWAGFFVVITSGARAGQMKTISSNTATVLTCSSLGTAPTAGDTFVIVTDEDFGDDNTAARNDGFIHAQDRDSIEIAHLDFEGFLGFFFSNLLEAQHTFNLAGSNDVLIHDCAATGMAGDGIFTSSTGTENFTTNVESYNLDFVDTGRQGITANATTDLHVAYSKWDFCGHAFIDIEPASGDSRTVLTADADSITPDLVEAGEDGHVATAATTTTITDSTAAWTINEWVNRNVRITSGVHAGTVKDITANTATQLTFTTALASAPSPGDTFDVERQPPAATYIGWWIKQVAPVNEDGYYRQIAGVAGGIYQLVASDPDPPPPGAELHVTKDGVARVTVEHCVANGIQLNVLAAGNANGRFCDDVTVRDITSDGQIRVGFGHLERRPQRLTMQRCTPGGGQFASGPHIIGVDGVIWDRVPADYQNRPDAPIVWEDCTDVVFIADDFDHVQVNAGVPAWGPIIRVVAGTYAPNTLAVDWDLLDVDDLDCGVFLGAGNTLYAELGSTFTISAANTAPDPTIIQEAGTTLGGYGTVAVRTPRFGDIVVTDGEEPAVAIAAASLYSFGTTSLGATTHVTDPVTVASDDVVTVMVGESGVAGSTRDPITVEDSLGHQFTKVCSLKAEGDSSRVQSVWIAQGVTSGTLTITYDWTPNDFSCIVDKVSGLPVGNNGVDAIVPGTIRIITTSPGNDDHMVCNFYAVQDAANALSAWLIAGANSVVIVPSAGDITAGWAKVNGIAPATGIHSMAHLFKVGDDDLQVLAEWGTSTSHGYMGWEWRAPATSITKYPCHPVAVPGGRYSSGSGTVFVTGDTTVTGGITHNGTNLIEQTSIHWDASFIGASIAGTGIQAGSTITAINADGYQATLSLPCTADGTAINMTVTDRKMSLVAGTGYLLAMASRKTTGVQHPLTVADTTGGIAWTLVQNLTYNTDWSLSLYKRHCTADIQTTVTVTFATLENGGSGGLVMGVPGVLPSVITSNIASSTPGSVTSISADLGPFVAPRNPTVLFIGSADTNGADGLTAPGAVYIDRIIGASGRHMTAVAADNNVDPMSFTWPTAANVAGIAVEVAMLASAMLDGNPRGVLRGILRGVAA